jgi:hypothetical protein
MRLRGMGYFGCAAGCVTTETRGIRCTAQEAENGSLKKTR